MRGVARFAIAALIATAPACRGGPVRPGVLDTHNDVCSSCRMPVSDPRLAAQLAGPGEEPRFFDDIGCLRDFLAKAGSPRSGAVAYVADHGTGRWTPASSAVFSRCPAVETPMGSHVIAHSDAASRSADPSAAGCSNVAVTDIFGPSGPPGSREGG
jgi:copper chaperone NosL